jgi:hypothetical protein
LGFKSSLNGEFNENMIEIEIGIRSEYWSDGWRFGSRAAMAQMDGGPKTKKLSASDYHPRSRVSIVAEQ